jgi:signal transduction histidine kinase/ABC-type uncharacterized transport system substrate-binding protein
VVLLRFLLPLLLISVVTLSAQFGSVSDSDAYFTEAPKKRVLILHSYYRGYKWTDDEHAGIESILNPAIGSSNIYTEYMDTKKAYGELYSQRLYEVYKIKFANFKFDVIVATDNNAFSFLLRYRDKLFPRTPVVFCGVNYLKEEDLAGHTGFTGVNEEADMKGCIDLALRIHPKTRNVVLINEWTTTGRRVHEEFLKVMPLFPSINFTLFEDVTMETILEELDRLPPDSVVLYNAFSRDKSGRVYEYNESISLVVRYCKVPIYSNWDFNLGHGVVGGLFTRGQDQGEAAGRLALQILKGVPVRDIPVMMTSPKHYVFDYRVMRHFGITPADLPRDSIVINTPQSFYFKYKKLIDTTAVVFAILLVIISILLVNIQRRKQTEKQLVASKEQLRTLSLRLSEAEETGRKMLSRELHDEIGQNLTILGVNLNLLRSLIPKEKQITVHDRITDSVAIVKQTTERVRNLMNDLRSPVLDDYGLVAAIDLYGKQCFSRTGINVSVRGLEPSPRLPAHVENGLFRIVQEAMTNVVKHARATEVIISLSKEKEKATLSVEDNGVGYDSTRFSRADGKSGWGLITMTERALALRGTCRIESSPGLGTQVVVEVPA